MEKYSPGVGQQPPVRFAVEAALALDSNNFVRFFKMVKYVLRERGEGGEGGREGGVRERERERDRERERERGGGERKGEGGVEGRPTFNLLLYMYPPCSEIQHFSMPVSCMGTSLL